MTPLSALPSTFIGEVSADLVHVDSIHPGNTKLTREGVGDKELKKHACLTSSIWHHFTDIVQPQNARSNICQNSKTLVHYHKTSESIRTNLNLNSISKNGERHWRRRAPGSVPAKQESGPYVETTDGLEHHFMLPNLGQSVFRTRLNQAQKCNFSAAYGGTKLRREDVIPLSWRRLSHSGHQVGKFRWRLVPDFEAVRIQSDLRMSAIVDVEDWQANERCSDLSHKGCMEKQQNQLHRELHGRVTSLHPVSWFCVDISASKWLQFYRQ